MDEKLHRLFNPHNYTLRTIKNSFTEQALMMDSVCWQVHEQPDPHAVNDLNLIEGGYQGFLKHYMQE